MNSEKDNVVIIFMNSFNAVHVLAALHIKIILISFFVITTAVVSVVFFSHQDNIQSFSTHTQITIFSLKLSLKTKKNPAS